MEFGRRAKMARDARTWRRVVDARVSERQRARYREDLVPGRVDVAWSEVLGVGVGL